MTALDEALSNVSNIHRRRVLLALLDQNPRTVEGLSNLGDTRTEDIEREDLQIQMQHIHLPKLEDNGYIMWNKDNQQVVKGPQFEEIKPLLKCLADHAEDISE